MDEHLERQYLEVELYEKIQVRERRKKGTIITLAFVLFLFLCGIPVYNERYPKWQSLRAAKNIAVEIEQIKSEALRLKKPLLFSVLDGGRMKVERVAQCGTGEYTTEEVLYEKNWVKADGQVVLLGSTEAKKFNLNLAVHQICFDPVMGVNAPKNKKVFILVPVKDLAESRLDRASYVEVETSSARISIN